MKRNIFIILAIISFITCIVCAMLINIQTKKRIIDKENAEFNAYLNKEILGTELATLINKAINNNEANSVKKDEKGYYIDNNTNSIKIDLKMRTIEKTYPMEEIYNNQMSLFVQNFNLIKFKCTSVNYHKKTGKISNLVFEEL